MSPRQIDGGFSVLRPVVPFDQREFGAASSGLDDIGFVYIPQSCTVTATACAVHGVFHGCKQGARVVGSGVYSSVGHNKWADSNGVVVLYPQAVATPPGQSLPVHPNHRRGLYCEWKRSGTP